MSTKPKKFAEHEMNAPVIIPEAASVEVYPDTEDALIKARDAVRRLLEEQSFEGAIRVDVHAGEYTLTEPLLFEQADSGRENAPVIWRAAGDGDVVISGGRKLTSADFRTLSSDDPWYSRFPKPEKIRFCDYNDLGLPVPSMNNGYGEGYSGDDNILMLNREKNAWPELFRGNVPLQTARYPESGWLRTAGCDNSVRMPYITFGCEDEGLWKLGSFEGSVYNGYPYFDWAFAAAPVESAAESEHSIKLAQKTSYGVRNGQRFFLSRIPEMLNSADKYIISPENGRIYVYAESDEDLSLRLSVLEGSLLRMNGVSHVYFERLGFAYARGSGAIIYGGEDVRFLGCRFFCLGYNAVRFGCQEKAGGHLTDRVANGGYHHLVQSCDVRSVGFGGFYISAGNRETLTPCDVVLDNCDVEDFSRIGKCYCFGVYLTCVGAVIRNCRFHDGAHSAIWFDGNDNIMEYNEFYDLLKEADDAACIYCGRDYTTAGNIIRWNYFHDMTSDARTEVSVFGTYCDDNSASLAVYGNFYYHMQGAHHSHGGHDIVVENNLVVGSYPNTRYSITFMGYGYPGTLKEGGQHDICMKNAPADTPLWHMRYPHLREYMTWDPDTEGRFPHYCVYRGNALVDHKPIEPNFAWNTDGWGNELCDNPVINEDPGFVDEEAGDLRLRPDSVIYRLIPDFKPIPFEKMGLYADSYRLNDKTDG